MIYLSIKLNQDYDKYVNELNLRTKKRSIDIYGQYLRSQDVTDSRRNKIERHLTVIKVLLPKDIKKLNMSILDDVKSKITDLPKRNIQKYRKMTLEEIVKREIPTKERITVETANDYIKILNQVLKFLYDREMIARQYSVTPLKSIVAARDQRSTLDDKEISKLLSAKNKALRSVYKISYYSGLRLSELYKCKLSIIDGGTMF